MRFLLVLLSLLAGCPGPTETDAGADGAEPVDAALDALDARPGDSGPIDAPLDAGLDAPEEDAAAEDAPVDAPAEMDAPVDTPADAPSLDVPLDAPVAPVDAPLDVPVDAPIAPLDAPVDAPLDVPVDAPLDVPPDAPCTEISGYRDRDDDGYGAGASITDCVESGIVLVPMAGDCDDGDGAVHPGALEACDGVDADCDAVGDASEPAADAACTWGCGGVACDAPVEVEAGWYHACVRNGSGALWCWGRDDDGEFGTAVTTGVYDAPVDLGVTADDLCTTANATCFLAGDTVRCFGAVVPGFPAPFSQVVPGVTEIECGDNELCVRTTGGDVLCAGHNPAGQCGTPPATSMLLTALTPVAITGATSISVGANFACAVAGGTVECWGADSGILGRGVTTTLDPVPAPVSAPGRSYVEVEAMNFAACARTAAGEVDCWGYTAERQVIDHVSPAFVTAPATTASVFRTLHGGPGLHACGIRATGELECWGTGLSFALGRPDTTSATPGLAMPGGAIDATDAAVASAGASAHTCVVETTTRRVLCWGANAFGQCGAPVSAMPLTTAVEVRP